MDKEASAFRKRLQYVKCGTEKA